MGIRGRRIENEWRLLAGLAQSNPLLVGDLHRNDGPARDEFHFRLRGSGALSADAGEPVISRTHDVLIRFPRYFPAVPMELELTTPVFHPNVHPETGFVCLWNRYRPGDSVVEAVARLQRVIAWELYNLDADQVMQPEAVRWLEAGHPGFDLPLPYTPVAAPESLAPLNVPRSRVGNRTRRRLEPLRAEMAALREEL